MAEKLKEFLGTGRRKTSVARVRLAAGSGKITVNGRAFETYFPTDTLRSLVTQRFVVTDSTPKSDARINVAGGLPAWQAGPLRHGISRALPEADINLRPSLKTYGFLTRD